MLQTRKLQFSYNAGTSFQFPDISCTYKETLLISGSSGVGKTTLLHLLAGLLKPDNGSIEINGINIALLNDKKLDHYRGRHIGIVFQESHFVASLSVIDNILLAQYLSGRKKDIKQASALLESLGIASQKNKKSSCWETGILPVILI